jgi:hypothetical protein
MADNKRSKKLIGGVIGGPDRTNANQSPNKRKSLPNKDKSEQKHIGINRLSERTTNQQIEFSEPVTGFRLPDGNIGISQADKIIPIGGVGSSGTINQEGNIVFNVVSNESNSVIFVNDENTFKTTPSQINFKLSDVVRDGQKVITVKKEGYSTTESYVIRIINNPNFRESTYNSYENKYVENDGILNIAPNKEIFTQTPPYSFKIDYYKDSMLQSYDAALENNEIKQIGFQLNLQSKVDKITTEPALNTVTINLEGPASSVIIVKDSGEQTKLTTGKNVIISDAGSSFQITSANLTLYKINKIQATAEGFNPKVLEPSGNESVSTKVTLNQNYVIDIISEQFSTITLETPSIDLVNKDEVRKYNINTKLEYPIALKKSGILSKITAYVGEKSYEFYEFGESESVVIILPKDIFSVVGNYKIFLVPSNLDGDGDSIEFSVTVVDEVYVGIPDIRNISYPTELIGPDYVGTNVEFEISYESVNTDYIRIYVNDSLGYIQEKAEGKVFLNFASLLNLANNNVSEDTEKISLNLKLIPYNISGFEVVEGIVEILKIEFKKGANQIPRNLVINRVSEAFLSQLDNSIFEDETSKYLTHLLHVGDGDNKVITTWTGSQDSLILKLYEPLPTSIQTNQEVWISKLVSNPIVETITLVSNIEEVCHTLKGPNFSLESDNGIEYQIYEDLVASGSATSTDLINEYAASVGIDTSNLNIQYVSGSTYMFENFINFSSAEERLNNFVYKVKLIEYYDTKYASLTSGIAQANEAKKITSTVNEIKRGFDGYEKYLYYTTNDNSNNLAYPKTNPSSSILINSTSSLVTMWYDNVLDDSQYYDKYNTNLLTNNIPSHLIEDTANEDFVTFLNMMGQHFDIIWTYINSLANVKKLEASQTAGISNQVVKYMLESLGWDTKKAFDSQFLWEYAFGTYKDGSQKYGKNFGTTPVSLKSANEEVWRRILNNLPYILKHKGTGRAMKAVMACYGVTQSMLTIMEFGGPQDPTNGNSTKFTFDDRTAAIYLSGSSSVKVPWKYNTGSLSYPNSVEFRIKPSKLPNTTYTLISGSEWSLDLIKTTGSFGKLELNFGGDQSTSTYINEPYISASISTYYFNPSSQYPYAYGPDLKTGSFDFPISTEHYSNIAINRHDLSGGGSWYEVWLGTSDGTRIVTSVSMSIESIDSQWQTGSYLHIGGNGYEGNVDEFRLWTVPLEKTKFDNHTLFPDAINGNSLTASTSDLLFRLDFEYPKDRILDPNIKNVSVTNKYGENYAYAYNMYSSSKYPYQYTPYDRTVTATVPSIGFAYANKIRFESASLVTDLSYKTRATKKSFDQSPIDSNRLGLFFSPIKELNMDILKTFGEFNVDNYIGDPSDEYKDTYKQLDTLREYYFQRLDRNTNEYIQLVKYIDKSLFDVLADLAPARAKVSKGLLIEPHYLERSKTRWDKPKSERNDYNSSINIDENNNIDLSYEVKNALLDATEITTFTGDISKNETKIDATEIYKLGADNPNYDSEIDYNYDELFEVTAPFYDVEIECPTGEYLSGEADSFAFEQIGMEKDSLANAGFGLYANNGTGIIKSYDGIFGNHFTTGSRQNIYLVKEQYIQNVPTQISGYPVNGSQPGDQIRYADIPVTKYKYKVSTVPFSGSIFVSNDIVEVKPLNGYFPTHYKYVNNLSKGLQNSYWNGSVQGVVDGVLTTPDGLPAVETFTTNPNILRVAKTGRGSGEPILEVD